MATYWRALWSTNVKPIRAAHESTNHTTICSAYRDPVQSTHVRSVVDPQRATFRSAFPMPIVTAIEFPFRAAYQPYLTAHWSTDVQAYRPSRLPGGNTIRE